jgi:serine/threonine protein phosphatase PrpC
MAELVHARDAPGRDSLTLAQSLVAYALERGGQDNVTVAVLRVGAGNIARVS